MGFLLSVLDFVQVDFPLLLHGFACPDFTLSVFGFVCLEPLTPALDLSNFGPSMLLRSRVHSGSVSPAYGLGRPEFLLSVPDPVHSESLLLLQSFGQLGFSLFLSGMSCLDLSPLLSDFGHIGSSFPLQSPV